MTNLQNNGMIEHHIKYKEIHGVDETVWLTKSEHIKLHKRLRRENKCTVPVNELSKISHAACRRTTKGKQNNLNYIKNNSCILRFSSAIMTNINLIEVWRYYGKGDSFSCSSFFMASSGNKDKLLIIDEDN